MQLKEQNTENLRDQLEEKRGQIEKLKSDMEAKVKGLEGSKARLIATLCKDSEEKWLFMKSDFEQKKKALMEKALSLASIVSQKDQKIDSHMSSLKISHKNSLTRADEGEKKARAGEKALGATDCGGGGAENVDRRKKKLAR